MAARKPSMLAYAVAAVRTVLRIGSLLLFAVFLWAGGKDWIDLHFPAAAILLWDAGLCAVFFLQHSCMIRRACRNWIGTIRPEYWHGIVYTVTSATALVLLVVGSQKSAVHIYTTGVSILLLMVSGS